MGRLMGGLRYQLLLRAPWSLYMGVQRLGRPCCDGSKKRGERSEFLLVQMHRFIAVLGVYLHNGWNIYRRV
jgi:hypothetical protein